MYIDPGHLDSTDPEDSYYYDTQGGYAFWQWWGALPWETDGLNLYLPFTGWREVYSDGIYYNHDDGNIIGTLDYKEGFMLAKPGAQKFDAYLCLEAGADKNKDEWNNYIAIGPGIRVAPFSKFDLKLSVEYFWGRYTRGGFDDTDEDISRFVFTLSFWHGW